MSDFNHCSKFASNFCGSGLAIGVLRGLTTGCLLVALCAAAGCSDSDSEAEPGGGGGSASTDAPTFAEVHDSVLSACAGCHPTGSVTPLNVDPEGTYWEAYNGLVGQVVADDRPCAGRELVIPNDCEGSLLYQKLTFTQDCGQGMPAGSSAPVVSDAQLQLLCEWIDSGADY